MDTIDLHSPPREQQSPSPSRTTDATIFRLFYQSSMGLPVEVWDHAIGFLERDAYALLACCLTCWLFHMHALGRLMKLHRVNISLHNYTDIDNFVERIRAAPRSARPIREVTLSRGDPPLAFSVVPHRLALQLVNLCRLYIHNIPEAPNVHYSTWPLYGPAFPSVEFLYLRNVQFPSFQDFIRFVASFRALKQLQIEKAISFTYPEVPQRSRKAPSGNLNLVDVQFPSFEDLLRFIASFHALDKLWLKTISFTHLGVPGRSPQFPSATQTILHHVKFLSFEHLLRFVASFPALKKLSIWDAHLLGASPIIPQFPSVVDLYLHDVHFPSFEDFIHFVTSFYTLQKLGLDSISCAHPGVLPSILQSTRTLNPLERLTLWHVDHDQGHFFGLLAHWLSLGSCVIQEINIDKTVGLHPSGYLLLQTIDTYIQKFTVNFFTSSNAHRRSLLRFVNALMHGFPNLPKLAFTPMVEEDIEYARALIAHVVRPNLMLDIDAFVMRDDNMDVWHLFDTVLFALRFCHKLQVHVTDKHNRGEFPLMSLFND